MEVQLKLEVLEGLSLKNVNIYANKNREEGTMEEGRIKERMAGSQAM